jgi:uncharacterized repeat protein (TIGR03943 family)
VKKEAQAVLLLLVGGTILKISFAGTYTRYVKLGLLPLLIIAGLALIAIAGATLWQVIRSARAGGTEAGHDHGDSRVAWLLLLPALALLLFAPPALGSYQASRNGTALGRSSNSDFPPLPDGDPVRISVLDYAGRAAFDAQTLSGRQVTLTGFVIAGPNGVPYLARMVVTCCAADGRPIKVGLTGDVPGNLKQDQWIEVDGTYTDRSDRDPVNSDVIPYLQVTALRPIAAPDQQYES